MHSATTALSGAVLLMAWRSTPQSWSTRGRVAGEHGVGACQCAWLLLAHPPGARERGAGRAGLPGFEAEAPLVARAQRVGHLEHERAVGGVAPRGQGSLQV
jgi:hypothetical protein